MSIIEKIFYAIIIISILIRGCFTLWRFFKDRENEAKCPSCGELWAAENLGDKIIGIFRKNQLRFFRRGISASDYKMVEYEKYKIHYKCKYCGHEWSFLKSRKQ